MSQDPRRASEITHHVDRLCQTRQANVLVLPHKQVEPRDKGKHVSVIVRLLQAVLRMALFIVPYAPLESALFMACDGVTMAHLVESNLDLSRRNALRALLDVGDVDKGLADLNVALGGLPVSFASSQGLPTHGRSEHALLVVMAWELVELLVSERGAGSQRHNVVRSFSL